MMSDRRKNLLSYLIIILLVSIFGLASCSKARKKEEAEKMSELQKLPDIKIRLAKYSPTEIGCDETLLNEEEKKVLEKLVLASMFMDNIFWKQASSQGLALKEKLEKSTCLLYTSPSPRDRQKSRMPSSA